METTGGNESTFQDWSEGMVAFIHESLSNADKISDITKALHKFCGQMKLMDDETKQRLSQSNPPVISHADSIIKSYLPAVMKKLEEAFMSSLLRATTCFKDRCSRGSVGFLPDPSSVSREFWHNCATLCASSQAESLKDAVTSMYAALQSVECSTDGFDIENVLGKYREHELQGLGAVCMELLIPVDHSTPVPELKVKLCAFEEGFTRMCKVLKETNVPYPWMVAIKPWMIQCLISPVMGNVIDLLGVAIQKAISAQPDGLETLITTRNSAKLRQVAFSKDTHMAATGSLEEFISMCKALDNVVTAGTDHMLITPQHVTKVKSIQAKTSRVKIYSSIIHGLNLCFHRFGGKGRKERSALLRECLGG